MADVWVVTVVHGRQDHLANQLRGLAISDPGTSHVVVAIDDLEVASICAAHRGQREVRVLDVPRHPLGLPLSSARNEGVSHALREGAELVVLLDVDCVAGVGAIDRYAAAAAAAGPSLLCGPVTYLPEDVALPGHPAGLGALRHPHPARPDPPTGSVQRGGDMNLFWSLSAALTPATWNIVGGFCEDYIGYGGEDTDLGRIADARGVGLVWVGGADVYHQHHRVSTPPVQHLDDIIRNAALFHARWGAWPMTGWLQEFDALGLLHFDGEHLSRLVPR